MNTHTWHVSITLAHDGFDVTARARLSDEAIELVGLGVAPVRVGEDPGRSTHVLAARRSLESLAEALGQLAQVDRLDPA